MTSAPARRCLTYRRAMSWPSCRTLGWRTCETDPTKAGGGRRPTSRLTQFAAEHTRSEQPWHLTKYIVPDVRNANGSTRNAAFKALHEAARDARGLAGARGRPPEPRLRLQPATATPHAVNSLVKKTLRDR